MLTAIKDSDGRSSLVEPEIVSTSGMHFRPSSSASGGVAYSDVWAAYGWSRSIPPTSGGKAKFDLTRLVYDLWGMDDAQLPPDGLAYRSLSVVDNTIVVVARINIPGQKSAQLRRLVIQQLSPSNMKSMPLEFGTAYYPEREIILKPDGDHRGNISKWAIYKELRKIIFYLHPSIDPDRGFWIKRGAEEWNIAFRMGEIPLYIEVLPSPKNVKWDVFSANKNIVIWDDRKWYPDPSRVRIGGGTAIKKIDLRTGEILHSQVILGDSENMMYDWFFTRCGRNAPDASKSLIVGRMTQRLAAHEFGHALGLKDGNYGKYVYPVAKARDKDWVRKWGYTPSVMNYVRCNSIAQPEDNMNLEDLIGGVGPADIYYILQGYAGKEKADAYLHGLPANISLFLDTAMEANLGPQYSIEVADTKPFDMTIEYSLKNFKWSVKTLREQISECHGSCEAYYQYANVITYWRDIVYHSSSPIGGKLYDKSMLDSKDFSWEDQKMSIDLSAHLLEDTKWINLDMPYFLDNDLKSLIDISAVRKQIYYRIFWKDRFISFVNQGVSDGNAEERVKYLFDRLVMPNSLALGQSPPGKMNADAEEALTALKALLENDKNYEAQRALRLLVSSLTKAGYDKASGRP